MKPKKWTEVYPIGTKEGDEEFAFFVSLARNPKYIWRSTTGISTDSGLPKDRVEEIIDKYFKLGMIFAHPKNDDSWGYWGNVPPDLLPKKPQSLVDKDHKQRIKKSTDK
jgi:hypothetical protein